MPESLDTKFASAQREATEEILHDRDRIAQEGLFLSLLEAFPEMVLILNSSRQVVYCNKALLAFLEISLDDILGKRPGEIFGCIHSCEEEGGCGTTEFCKECGSVNAILTSQEGKVRDEEWRLTAQVDDNKKRCHDLRVHAVPLVVEGKPFTVFTIHNIADEKRRQILEKTFFHDVLNELSAVMIYLDLLDHDASLLNAEAVKNLHRMSRAVLDTIEEQRDLLAAEQGSLQVVIEPVAIKELLGQLVAVYLHSGFAGNRTITIDPLAGDEVITTDKVLLFRVVGNLIKNALEASSEHGTVRCGYKREQGYHVLYVHNEGVMSEEVQHQIFQRSFTTKGRGRGIGAYSVRFLTEQYLRGQVRFISSQQEGTVFFIELPE